MNQIKLFPTQNASIDPYQAQNYQFEQGGNQINNITESHQNSFQQMHKQLSQTIQSKGKKIRKQPCVEGSFSNHKLEYGSTSVPPKQRNQNKISQNNFNRMKSGSEDIFLQTSPLKLKQLSSTSPKSSKQWKDYSNYKIKRYNYCQEQLQPTEALLKQTQQQLLQQQSFLPTSLVNELQQNNVNLAQLNKISNFLNSNIIEPSVYEDNLAGMRQANDSVYKYIESYFADKYGNNEINHQYIKMLNSQAVINNKLQKLVSIIPNLANNGEKAVQMCLVHTSQSLMPSIHELLEICSETIQQTPLQLIPSLHEKLQQEQQNILKEQKSDTKLIKPQPCAFETMNPIVSQQQLLQNTINQVQSNQAQTQTQSNTNNTNDDIKSDSKHDPYLPNIHENLNAPTSIINESIIPKQQQQSAVIQKSIANGKQQQKKTNRKNSVQLPQPQIPQEIPMISQIPMQMSMISQIQMQMPMIQQQQSNQYNQSNFIENEISKLLTTDDYFDPYLGKANPTEEYHENELYGQQQNRIRINPQGLIPEGLNPYNFDIAQPNVLKKRMSLNNNDISGRNMYLYNKNSEAQQQNQSQYFDNENEAYGIPTGGVNRQRSKTAYELSNNNNFNQNFL